MESTAILQKMLLLLMTIAIGFIANKCGAMDAPFTSKLSKFLLNVTVPGALLSSGMSGDISFTPVQLLRLFLIAAALFLLMFAFAYAVPLAVRADPDEIGTYRFLTAFVNTIFMGYPVATAFFGSSAVIYIALLSLPFNIAVFSVGPMMLSGQSGKDFSWKSLLNGGTVSSVAALLLILFNIRVPAVISELCSSVGSATTPIALIVIGSNLAEMPMRDIFGSGRMYLFSVFRLVVIPFAVWFVFRSFIADPVILGCTIILGGLPSASMATLVSAKYGGNERLASQGVMLTTLLSAFTIPVVMYLLLSVLA